jgi:hypothetical protein
MIISGETRLRRFVGDPINYYFYEGNLVFEADDGRIYEPTTFLTDEATIPRIFWSIPGFSPADWLEAALLHDWCYIEHKRNSEFTMTRREADDLLYQAMRFLKIGRVTSLIVWSAARLLGQSFWDGTNTVYK